eukprot:GHVS01031584.1.p1 GENE.GHVS01031584.1~~GHVS01031584.1.p1  ORF type:complete len:198 (-),score=14.50 GHVS01031584.1:73-666(-)
MGNSISKADFLFYGSSFGFVGFALCSNSLQSYLWAFRPLLNASWGFLFGSSVWSTMIQGPALMQSLPKQTWAPVQAKAFGVFYKASCFSSGLLFLCTAALAPHSSLLLRCSLFSFVSSMINSLYLVPRTSLLAAEKLQREGEYNIGRSTEPDADEDIQAAKKDEKLQSLRKQFGLFHGLSMFCAYSGVCSLLPYVFV